MYGVEVEIRFEAAHRLYDYEGACHNLHGHSYVAYVSLESDVLVSTGFVVDFKFIKSIVKKWIDEKWDHATLLFKDDPLVDILGGITKTYIMQAEPTAEWMARTLYNRVESLLPSLQANVKEVSIMETVTSKATYRGE